MKGTSLSERSEGVPNINCDREGLHVISGILFGYNVNREN